MIKVETAHIEEIRGIKKLDISFDCRTFAISGPNGSGKSGVIDAIEFGLTGDMSRLSGRGTRGLTVSDHGPHVDKARFPQAAFVELHVYIPHLKTSATIKRGIAAPNKPQIVPDTPAIREVFSELADHPEITLSRKEVLRFILVEPSKRAEEIQTLLKLDEVGQMRAALKTAKNRIQGEHLTAESTMRSRLDALQRHLQVQPFQIETIQACVNKHRAVLNLPPLDHIDTKTKLDDGVASGGAGQAFNKETALRDLAALSNALEEAPKIAADERAKLAALLTAATSDPDLMRSLQRETLLQRGLELVDDEHCPLCDSPWDSAESLRQHLRHKLTQSEKAKQARRDITESAGIIARALATLKALIEAGKPIAGLQGDVVCLGALGELSNTLQIVESQLASFDSLVGLKGALAGSLFAIPAGLQASLASLVEMVSAKPDQAATVQSQSFLTTAQVRLEDYRKAKRRAEATKKALDISDSAYTAYCEAQEHQLGALYQAVQVDFSNYYRALNEEDESKFTAQLSPTEGKLDFTVNFYDRGLFPPAAYHSEGHQDGMGVCLYLALMKRLFSSRFTVALLDDVVMSVDADHRREFCRLLASEFGDTQFIITTHDRLWAEQMRASKLITRKSSLAFHSWSVDSGPLVESSQDIWVEIDSAVARGKVEIAAPALRRHLEFVSRLLADQLGAAVPFHADGNYELGELLPNVLKRMKDLYGKAAESAHSWDRADQKQAIIARKQQLSACSEAMNVEQWAVNRAVHYNAWANFGRRDFEPVVAAARNLLDCMRCETCDTWLFATPAGRPDSLRCECTDINFNLRSKD